MSSQKQTLQEIKEAADLYRGYTKFNLLMLLAFQDVLDSYSKANRNEVGDALVNTILDLDGPKHAKAELSKRGRFIASLWKQYIEIPKSIEALDQSEKYIKYAPSRKLEIKLTDHITYHLYAYFNELYILKLRMDAFSKIVVRRYMQDADSRRVTTKNVDNLLKSFDRIVKTRGHHVHKMRYESPEIDRLSMLEQLVSLESPTLANIGYTKARVDVRKKWLSNMKLNREGILELLDDYVAIFMPVLFPDGKNLYVPEAV